MRMLLSDSLMGRSRVFPLVSSTSSTMALLPRWSHRLQRGGCRGSDAIRRTEWLHLEHFRPSGERLALHGFAQFTGAQGYAVRSHIGNDMGCDLDGRLQALLG